MLNDEKKIVFAEAAAQCPHRPHVSAIWRWCRKGLKTAGGGRVRLEHVRIGGRIYTSNEAMQRFFAAVAAADVAYFQADDATFARETEPSSAQREQEIAAADRRLTTAGL